MDSTNDISSPFWSFITHKATKNNSAVFGTKSSDSWLGRRSNGTFLQVLTSVVSGGSHPSSTIIRTDQVDGSDSKIFSNGTSVATGDSGSTRPNFGRIGAQGTLDSAKFLGGNIQEIIIYNSDQSTKRRAIEENIANHYDISLAAFSRDGTVSTWYDQSGNTNDAVQTDAAKQPKIVENGNLLSNGVTFDFTNYTELRVTGKPVITASSSGTYSAFSVQNVSTEENGYLYGNASTDDGTSLYAATVDPNSTVPTYNLSDRSSANNFRDRIERSSGENLLSAVYNNGDAGLLVNGAGTMTDDGTYIFSAGTSDFVIGNRNGGSISEQYLTGSIKEIIVYNSNQSDNRTALEANIGETYGITAIPAANDTVNGYVQTWYDQSGSGNNAEQPVAVRQPKIVDAGSLIAGGIDFREAVSVGEGSFNLNLAVTQLNIFAVFRRSDPVAASLVHLVDNPGFSTVHFTDTNYVRYLGGAFSQTSVTYNTDGSDNLVSSINQTTAQGGSSLHVNGSPVQFSGTTSVNASMTIQTIGGFNAWSNLVNQIMSELIIYDSDQTANRPAIETNIANQYDITLS